MKASVTQQQLAHGLGIVGRAISSRSTLPVLANVLIATDEGRLRLSATNLELGITTWVGAQIQDEGSLTVPARSFTDLVNALKDDRVQLTGNLRTQSLNVKTPFSTTDIKGISADEYPPMPVPDLSDGMEFKAGELKDMIQQVAFAASTDEARPVLQGVQIQVREAEIAMAATDGYRISVSKLPLGSPAGRSVNIIVPAKALTELARLLSDPDGTVSMHIPPGRNQVIFRLKDAELVSQLIEGNFPDYRAIIPKSLKTHTVVSTSNIITACKQAEIIARDSNYIVRVNIQGRGDEAPGVVEISATSEETGQNEVQVDATIEGPNLVIAFNVRYLREVLEEAIKTPSVALETNASNSPAVVRPIGDDNYVHVIMPMHVG